MGRILPPQPSLEHLRNEAKALLKAHARGDASACPTLRRVHRFQESSDAQVLSAEVALAEAQFALAMDYGFESWDALKKQVAQASGEAPEDEPGPGAVLLENPPPGKGNSNRVARGLAMALAHAGAAYDYDTLMGDSGLAFILQADSSVTPWGTPVKQIDIGWWPLDWWGALLRLDFVGRAAGRSLRYLTINSAEFRPDPKGCYQRHLHATVVETLRRGLLPLAMLDFCWAVTACDDGDPPLLGARTVFDGRELRRLPRYPCTLIVPGDPLPPMPREEADPEAIRYAVGLMRDEVPVHAPGCPQQETARAAGRSSGRKSFALWARLLRDPDGWGAHFYHANVVMHLRLNRHSAPPYLRAMADRRPGAADPLRRAAEIFEQELAALRTAHTRKETLSLPEGRETLARLIEQLAALEANAIPELERAAAAL